MHGNIRKRHGTINITCINWIKQLTHPSPVASEIIIKSWGFILKSYFRLLRSSNSFDVFAFYLPEPKLSWYPEEPERALFIDIYFFLSRHQQKSFKSLKQHPRDALRIYVSIIKELSTECAIIRLNFLTSDLISEIV